MDMALALRRQLATTAQRRLAELRIAAPHREIGSAIVDELDEDEVLRAS
jgi:hypothetical protein